MSEVFACNVCDRKFATAHALQNHKQAKGHGRKSVRQSAVATGTKARNERLTAEILEARAQRAISAGYSKQKWVEFCEIMMAHGFTLYLYEARHTFSKYVTVMGDGRAFKVRFSNHRPNRMREEAGDCDFFVGVTNLTITTTAQAIAATLRALRRDEVA